MKTSRFRNHEERFVVFRSAVRRDKICSATVNLKTQTFQPSTYYLFCYLDRFNTRLMLVNCPATSFQELSPKYQLVLN